MISVNFNEHISFTLFCFLLYFVSKNASYLYVYSDAIWNQRTQIYPEELLNGKLPKSMARDRKKSNPESSDNAATNNKSNRKTSPSPTPLSGTETDNNNNDDNDIDAKSVDNNDTLRLHEMQCDQVPSPPLLRTPPSPPKIHNELYSPVAKRYPPPKLIQNASTGSLLDPMPEITEKPPCLQPHPSLTHSLYSQPSIPSKSCTPYDSNKVHQFEHDEITPDILDAAIASVERENLEYVPANDVNCGSRCQSPSENQHELSQAKIDAMIEAKYLKRM